MALLKSNEKAQWDILIRVTVFNKRVSEALAIEWRREGQLRKCQDIFVKH
jgi:hypothetical protein